MKIREIDKAIHRDENVVLIADTGNDRVQAVTTGGKFLRLIGGAMKKGREGRMQCVSDLAQPEDVALTSCNTIIVVADTGEVLYGLI